MARLKQTTPLEVHIDKASRHTDGIIQGMDSSIELIQGDAQSSLPEWLHAQFSALQFQLAECDAELKRRELKIQQLTPESAHHKRLRFGSKSEVLSPEQRDLFIDCRDEDGAAIITELEQQEASSPPRNTNGPAAIPFRRNCPGLSIAMNRPLAHAENAVPT